MRIRPAMIVVPFILLMFSIGLDYPNSSKVAQDARDARPLRTYLKMIVGIGLNSVLTWHLENILICSNFKYDLDVGGYLQVFHPVL